MERKLEHYEYEESFEGILYAYVCAEIKFH